MSKYDKEAQRWVNELTEDHVAEQFKEMRPFWLAISIIATAFGLAYLLVSGL